MNRSSESGSATIRRVHYLMGGPVEIEAAGVHSEQVRAAVRAAFMEIRRIEALLSRYREGSVISKINREAGRFFVPVPSEVIILLKACLQYSRMTQGAFDLTLLPLIRMWEEAGRAGRCPEDQEIREALNLTGWKRVHLDEERSRVFLEQPGCGLDPGAAGKGYAVDRALSVLREGGVTGAIVSTGSSIACLGQAPFLFGIRDPRRPEDILTSVRLSGGALATSGNTQRFHRIRNRKFGHVLNPVSGRPAESDLLSVTVTASCALEADILSTAILAGTMQRARNILRSFPHARAVFVRKGILPAHSRVQRF